MRNFVKAAIASALMIATAPLAFAGGSFELSPVAYKQAAEDYMSGRLSDPRSARYNLAGDPYRVQINMRGSDVEAWAVDIRVKSRLPNGSWSNYQRYTVIFRGGNAVALKSDFANVIRV